MIPANELRLGNYFLDHKGRVVKIHGIDSTWNYIWLNYANGSSIFCLELNRIKAIILTPEILEKCGFGKRDRYPYKMAHGYLKMRNGIFFFKYYDIEIEVTHLHQLQNLYFALTGEELNIKL